VIVKNRADYYVLHTSVCANMGIRSAHQHEIALSQKFLNLSKNFRVLKFIH